MFRNNVYPIDAALIFEALRKSTDEDIKTKHSHSLFKTI